MKYLKNHVILVFLVFNLVVSCRTLNINREDRTIELNTSEIIKGKLKSTKYPENLLISNASLRITGETQSTLRLNIFMKRDHLIYLNGRYMGFEVFRFMINKDSVKFINRFQRTYYFDTKNSFVSKYGLSIEISDIQDFIYSGFITPKDLNNALIRGNFNRIDDRIVYDYILEEGKKINLSYDLKGELNKIIFSDYSDELFVNMDLGRKDGILNDISGELIREGDMIEWNLEIQRLEYTDYHNLDFRIGNNYYETQNIF